MRLFNKIVPLMEDKDAGVRSALLVLLREGMGTVPNQMMTPFLEHIVLLTRSATTKLDGAVRYVALI